MLILMALALGCAWAIDYVGILWHKAREEGRVHAGAALACLHEALTWAPIILAIEGGNTYALAASAIVGVWIANVRGLRRWAR